MDFATVVPPYVAKPLALSPFKAVMLSPARVGDPASARALARPYRDVADRLTGWITQGWAREDSSPALYLHEYTVGGLTIRGLVGVLDVSRRAELLADRAVWPHEAIHLEQAGELADRMLQMKLNPAPILLVHHGDRELRELISSVGQGDPDWSYLDRAGQRQRIWAIRDRDLLADIARHVAAARCLLADGHHRYAAYLRLQQEHPGSMWSAGLAMLVDQLDTPLFLGPIHRTVSGADLDAMAAAARSAGAAVRELGRARALGELDRNHLVLTDSTKWVSVRPHGLEGATLVAWLHETLLPGTASDTLSIAHHHSVEDALATASTLTPAVLLPSPDFGQVRALVESGGLLPEKATSFQPKPSLGALMRPVPDE
ncbi:MAG: DUF1015 domain-containing protein [Nocardioides sp.]|nr:DUF1015 domain-containing protein [Nocardioides sp.]